MEFVGYKTHDKLLSKSDIVDRNTNMLYSKVKPSTHVRKSNSALRIGFSNCPCEGTCDIISDHHIKYDIQHFTTFKQG